METGTSKKGQEGPYTNWPASLCPLLHAAGTVDPRPAWDSQLSPSEARSFFRNEAPSAKPWIWAPEVFSWLSSLIKRKDLRFLAPYL